MVEPKNSVSSTKPGATTFAVMPSGPSIAASWKVQPMTAALDAE